MAVADSEGTTLELAAARVALCNTAGEWAESFRDGDYLLQSAFQIEGMLNIIDQDARQRMKRRGELDHLHGKSVTRTEFNRMLERQEIPPDSRFVPDRYEIDGFVVPHPSNGTVQLRSEERISRDAEKLKRNVRAKLRKAQPLTRRNGGTERRTHRAFTEHYQGLAERDQVRLESMEVDYHQWLKSEGVARLLQNDFAEGGHGDGVWYALCVSNLLFGGPMTRSGLQHFACFLGDEDEPTRQDALIVRALLGNRPEFFTWLKEADQQMQAYEIGRGIYDLDPVKQAIAAGRSEFLAEVNRAVAELKSIANATANGLAGLGSRVTDRVAYQFKLLSMMVIQKSSNAPFQVLRLQVSLPEAVRIWNTMMADVADAMRRVGQAATRRVESLVLGFATAVELNVGTSAGMGVVDVYLLVRGDADTWREYTRPVKDSVHKYLVQPVNTTAGRAVATAGFYMQWSGVRSLTNGTVDVLRTGSGALAAGAALLQGFMIRDAWSRLDHGSDEERRAASIGLLTSGMGVMSATLDLAAIRYEQVGRKVIAAGVRRVAGLIGAGATAIDGVHAFLKAYEATQTGDKVAQWGHGLQGALFILAAGALSAATVAAFSGTTVLGMTAAALTGWGLLLIGLGVLVGFFIMLWRDSPVEAWADATFWGDARRKWGSLDREIEEANKLLAGLEADFSYRYSTLQLVAAGMSYVGPLGIPRMSPPGGDVLQTREAWLRIRMPEEVRDKLPWRLRLYARRAGSREDVLAASMTGDANMQSISGPDVFGLSELVTEFQHKIEGDIIVLQAQLRATEFISAHATVEVFASAPPGVILHRGFGDGVNVIKVVDEIVEN